MYALLTTPYKLLMLIVLFGFYILIWRVPFSLNLVYINVLHCHVLVHLLFLHGTCNTDGSGVTRTSSRYLKVTNI